MDRRSGQLLGRLALTALLMQIGNQAAYFVGMIGTASYMLDATAVHISVLVASIALSNVIGSGIVGVVIDRLGPRIALTGSLLGYAACLLVAFFQPLEYSRLLFASAFSALFFGGANTVIAAFPPYIVQGRDALKDANSLADSALHLAIVLGPLAGGFIASAVDAKATFLFGAVMLIASAAVSLTLEKRFEVVPEHAGPENDRVVGEDGSVHVGDHKRGPIATFLSDFGSGLEHTFESEQLSLLFALGFFGFFAYGAFDSLESLYYRDVLRVGVEWMGWLSMLSGVGAVIGSIILLKLPSRHVNFTSATLMLMITGIGTMIYVGTDQLLWAGIGQTLTGFGFGLMMPIQHMLMQESCELPFMGRVSSVMRIGMNTSGILPLAISPALATVFGVQPVLLGASTIVALMGVLFVLHVRRSDTLS